MASHLRYYKYYVNIKDYDEDKIVFSEYFDDIINNEYFLVIDKQNLGEEIGVSIIGDLKNREEEITEKIGEYRCDNEVFDKIDFTQEFKDELMTMIEEEITNFIRNDIQKYVLEYLGDNM